MKEIQPLLSLFAIVLFATGAYAGEETKTVKISTSAQCGMCESTIEEAVNKLDGVEKADLKLESKALTVTYQSSKLSANDIRKAVSNAGYDADQMKGDKKAHDNLPSCCQHKETKKKSGGGC